MPRIKQTNKSSAPANADRIKTILDCKDPLFFIKKYCKVSHPTKGLIAFETFPYQDDCVRAFEDHRFNIINKSRQLGLSTVSAAYSLWLALFHKEKNVLCIATDLGVASNFMKKVFTCLDNLPSWIVLPKVTKRTVKELRFSNGSQVKAIATTKSAGRSEAVSLLILDETAHIDDVEDIWLGLSPTLSTGGSAIMISTPNGVGNLFHKIWVEAHEKRNEFYAVELPWQVHPEHDEVWFEKESMAVRAAKGERGIAQEFLCSFLSSGDTFIKPEYMEMLEKHVSNPIAEHPKYRDLWIWKHSVPGHKYLISMDIARGDAQDFSAAMIFDTNSDELVAEYKGKIPPDQFANLAIEVAKNYNNALICPENNGPGLVTATELKKSNYQNLFYEKIHKNMYAAYTNQDVSNELCGISTQAKNREEMLTKLENILRNGYVKIPSKRYLQELKTFVYKGTRAQAMKGYNDDLIMASAIGMSLFETSEKTMFDEDEIRMALLGNMSTTKAQINNSPFGGGMMPIMTSKQMNGQQYQQTGQGYQKPSDNGFQQGTRQDHRDPFWAQWAWVVKD
jgi:hypothetical protein